MLHDIFIKGRAMETNWNFAKGIAFAVDSIFKCERKIPTDINWSSKYG